MALNRALYLLTAAATAHVLVRDRGGQGSFTNLGFFKAFICAYFALSFLWLVYARYLVPKWLSPLLKLPQPKGGSWWNGHFWAIFSSGTAEVERRWMHEIPNDGFIYYQSILNQQRLIVTSERALQEICMKTDKFTKPTAILGLAKKLLGLGLVLTEGEVHKKQRRAFLPIFAPRHVRDMYSIFWLKTCEVTQKLTQIIETASPKGGNKEAVFEVGHWASRAALDIVTMATLGEDFGAIEDENSRLAKTYRMALEPSRGYLILAMLKLYFPEWLIDALPNRWNRNTREYVPIFRAVCRDLLRKRRRDAADKTLPAGKDLLSLCFHYEEVNHADEEALIDQMTTFLAAGHETISVGITWTIYMLCLHPEWQPILRREARTHFPNPNDPGDSDVGSTDVEMMPMMQAFINEVLRWYPPIPETMRVPIQDMVIDGQWVPKGVWMIIPIKGLHRDERFWGPDANTFNPRRWLNPDGTFNATGGVSSKYASLSFMQGSRSCVAQGFSKAEMACIMSAWVGSFEFELVDPELHDEEKIKISKGSFSGRPVPGLFVKWRIANGWMDSTATF
ncbi:cytochrome P450 [Nemania serpens]|nr:cytochrome P450 [Nemania serpens]